MKIKIKQRTLGEVLALPRPKHQKPKRPNLLFRTLVRVASIPDLWAVRARYTFPNKREILREPCLILMNHSCFLDLELASKILFPRPYCIVSTTDGLVGKAWLMRQLGCIPTQKFVSDLSLIKDMKYALREKRSHVLMFPEAGYSFDGCATALPEKLGGIAKLLGVPVVMIRADGAFLRDPLYNGLQKRRVRVEAECSLLLSREQINEGSTEELSEIISRAFAFDSFERQFREGIEIKEPFRADGLHRILYKCPHCMTEGCMKGEGIRLECSACGKRYHLSPLGRLEAEDGEGIFAHVPDWFRWERECVREELEKGSYTLDTEVDLGMLVDHKALYMVGKGRLLHTPRGFALRDEEGNLLYEQKPLFSHCLNADFYWYEIGDVIGIGNAEALYYCFVPKGVSVAKARLATEELYRMSVAARRSGGRRRACTES